MKGAPAGIPHRAPYCRWRNTCAALLMAACTGCASHDDAAQSAPVNPTNVTLTEAQRRHIRTYTVETTTYRKTTEAVGSVDFDNDQATGVIAPFSGPVVRVLVSLGAHVNKGDPLAEVDSPDFATAIGSYRKALATARTDRRLADLDRDLLQHHGVAQREAEQAETDAVNAEADRDAALQELVSLKVPGGIIKNIEAGRPIRHAGATLRAPIGGTVVEKLITPGQLLEAGATPCFTVADLSRVWVLAQVFGADLHNVAVGDSADVLSGDGARGLTGRVDNLSALVDPDTRAVIARVVVENPDNLLKKGMYVHAQIRARQPSAGLLVPDSAILRDDENLPFVYRLQPDGAFARQHVTAANRVGDRIEIAEGIKAGDQIVIDGALFLQFMQSQ